MSLVFIIYVVQVLLPAILVISFAVSITLAAVLFVGCFHNSENESWESDHRKHIKFPTKKRWWCTFIISVIVWALTPNKETSYAEAVIEHHSS